MEAISALNKLLLILFVFVSAPAPISRFLASISFIVYSCSILALTVSASRLSFSASNFNFYAFSRCFRFCSLFALSSILCLCFFFSLRRASACSFSRKVSLAASVSNRIRSVSLATSASAFAASSPF